MEICKWKAESGTIDIVQKKVRDIVWSLKTEKKSYFKTSFGYCKRFMHCSGVHASCSAEAVKYYITPTAVQYEKLAIFSVSHYKLKKTPCISFTFNWECQSNSSFLDAENKKD